MSNLNRRKVKVFFSNHQIFFEVFLKKISLADYYLIQFSIFKFGILPKCLILSVTKTIS
jgi:hypothetical protein